MLTLDLARLEREGRLPVRGSVPADDPLWQGTELEFDGPLEVRMEAILAGSGEVVVQGRLGGTLRQECRRCLDPVRTEVDHQATFVWAPKDELEDAEEDDGEVRTLPPSVVELELDEAIREELVLALERFVVCDPECRGLCPRCGADLNEDECDCSAEEPDPRWDALRALKNE